MQALPCKLLHTGAKYHVTAHTGALVQNTRLHLTLVHTGAKFQVTAHTDAHWCKIPFFSSHWCRGQNTLVQVTLIQVLMPDWLKVARIAPLVLHFPTLCPSSYTAEAPHLLKLADVPTRQSWLTFDNFKFEVFMGGIPLMAFLWRFFHRFIVGLYTSMNSKMAQSSCEKSPILI